MIDPDSAPPPIDLDPLPWRDVTAGLTARIPPAEAGASPCAGCIAPCCWMLLVERGAIEDEEDIARIGAHLRYQRFVAWCDDDGEYAIGFTTPCTHLDSRSFGCRLYGTAERPAICDDYDAAHCWYRWHIEADGSTVARADGGAWPALRTQLLRRVEGSGGLSGGERERVLYDNEVELQFDLPADMVESPTMLTDLLRFFANFERVSVARAPAGWFIVCATRRASGEAPSELEVVDGRLGGADPDEVVRVSSKELAALERRFGTRVFEMSVPVLRAALSEYPGRPSK